MTKKIKLNAKNLADTCFIGKPIEKEITWHNGDSENTATVYVKPLSYHEAMSDIDTMNDSEDNRKAVAKRIASSIVDEDGNAVFTPGDIDGTANPERGAICSSLTIALLSAIGEVNGLGKG
ncbi:MAG: phage tail assembly chaperone family protein, TAC [Gammaproteobacteria bacterium]|nr:phage tail assembly chaperone family protein, TAC [Gammaproteobacteria bacterium]